MLSIILAKKIFSLFDNQPEYASVINVVTATLCTVTMPLIVWLYQL